MTEAKLLQTSDSLANVSAMNKRQSKAKSALILRHINVDVISRVQEDGSLHVSAEDNDYIVDQDGRIYDATNAIWVAPSDLLNDLTQEFEAYHRHHDLKTEPDKEDNDDTD